MMISCFLCEAWVHATAKGEAQDLLVSHHIEKHGRPAGGFWPGYSPPMELLAEGHAVGMPDPDRTPGPFHIHWPKDVYKRNDMWYQECRCGARRTKRYQTRCSRPLPGWPRPYQGWVAGPVRHPESDCCQDDCGQNHITPPSGPGGGSKQAPRIPTRRGII